MANAKEIALVREIAGLCVEINCIGDYSAFMSFSGHVNWIEVHLGGAGDDYAKNITGWSTIDSQIYLSDDSWNKPKDCVKNLEGLRDRLNRIRDGIEKPIFEFDSIASKLKAIGHDTPVAAEFVYTGSVDADGVAL